MKKKHQIRQKRSNSGKAQSQIYQIEETQESQQVKSVSNVRLVKFVLASKCCLGLAMKAKWTLEESTKSEHPLNGDMNGTLPERLPDKWTITIVRTVISESLFCLISDLSPLLPLSPEKWNFKCHSMSIRKIKGIIQMNFSYLCCRGNGLSNEEITRVHFRVFPFSMSKVIEPSAR